MIRYGIFIAALFACIIVLQVPGLHADEITINNVQVTVINSPDSSSQVLMLLQFSLPPEIDTTATVNFGELSMQVSYQLNEGLPMVLGCAALLPEADLTGVPFDSLRANLGQYTGTSFLATAPFGDSSGAGALFDITQIVSQWALDPSTFNGLLILPFDNQSFFYGLLPEDPTVTIKITFQEHTEE